MTGWAVQADVFRFAPGDTPLLVSIPHTGVQVPEDIVAGFTEAGLSLADTDWHLDRLYAFAPDLGVGVLAANYSRYVIDLNRNPQGASLYPGQDVTELCPTTTFDRAPIYRPGRAPDEREIARRVERYWTPYHQQVESELERLRARFGHAVLFEAHSIRSRVPRFYDGVIPDLNLGTADGITADADLERSAWEVLDAADGYSAVRNGRFKGGFLTRAFGHPEQGWHAMQLEMSQRCYMDESPPWTWRDERAEAVAALLTTLLETLRDWRPA